MINKQYAKDSYDLRWVTIFRFTSVAEDKRRVDIAR
jgi:hypothetical protein